MSLALPPKTFQSYVQVNLYGTSLREIKRRGVNIPQLLSSVGFSHCVMNELTLFPEEIHRHLDSLNPTDRNLVENAAELLDPTREVKEEEAFENDKTQPLTYLNGTSVLETPRRSIRHSSPFCVSSLLHCSLSTINSGSAPTVYRLPSAPSSLNVTPAEITQDCSQPKAADDSDLTDAAPSGTICGMPPVVCRLPTEPSSLSIDRQTTQKSSLSKAADVSMAADGCDPPDSASASAIMSYLNGVLYRVQSEGEELSSEGGIPAPVAVSPGFDDSHGESFFDCSTDLPDSRRMGDGYECPIDLPKQSHPDTSFAMREEYDSLDAMMDFDDFSDCDDLELFSIKEEELSSGGSPDDVSDMAVEDVVEREGSVENENPEERAPNEETSAAEEEKKESDAELAFDDAEETPVVKKPTKPTKSDITRTVKCQFQSCEKVFAWKPRYGSGRLIHHARQHCIMKPWKCQLCNFKSVKKYYVQRHHKRSHPGLIYVQAVDCTDKTDDDFLALWSLCFPGVRLPIVTTMDAVKERPHS